MKLLDGQSKIMGISELSMNELIFIQFSLFNPESNKLLENIKGTTTFTKYDASENAYVFNSIQFVMIPTEN